MWFVIAGVLRCKLTDFLYDSRPVGDSGGFGRLTLLSSTESPFD